MGAKATQLSAGSIPEAYDRHLGPLLFEPYAADLAERVKALAPRKILEVAAGTGIATRALAAALPEAEILASDASPAMIDLAATRLSAPGVAFQQADAHALPFEDARFDCVACQFGVMFFGDRRAAFLEARRVLAPGGRYLFSVWADLGANDFAEAVTEELEARFPEDPPRFLMRTPYGHHNIGHLSHDLAAAGFTDVRVDTLEKKARAPSARDVAIGFCQASTPLGAEIAARDPGGVEATTEAVAEALTRRFGAGPIEGRLRAHIFSAAR
ncbi:MAG TPA: class I SAM-dependent methyltransferase [Dongiaceae bacterium]|nr:class I SAM-dependent methyltransferase [Dongiaceae bacterium]